MTIQEQKAHLRRRLRAQLMTSQLPHEQLRIQLKSWLVDQAGIWGAFWPLEGEPDLRPLWHELGALTWACPRIQDERLLFHLAGSEWEVGPYGLQEPARQTPQVLLESIQGLCIPGLGFDRRGRRLGRGKGYYDRLLQEWKGLRVGVCFEHQWVEEVPSESHDQAMDLIVTEAGLYEVPKGR